MSRKEREKRAAAEGGASGAGDAPFAEARCFVLSAGHEYKRRDRASHAAIVLHVGAPGDAHPCVRWAAAAEALFARCVWRLLTCPHAPTARAHGATAGARVRARCSSQQRTAARRALRTSPRSACA
jgi:hypothetical protein